VKGAASLEGRARIRLFCALRLPDDTLEALRKWQAEHLAGRRIVARDHLHVTLAFLGHRPLSELALITDALRIVAAGAGTIRLAPERYRETRSVGMLVLTDEAGRATRLAGELHERLERTDVYERERRNWLPHVTVVRFEERPRLRPPLPRLAPFTPSDAAVYHSVLRSTGAQYEIIESFALGG
jgi:RNA 2',3'-cyclic 3'-phosphodiesterase